MGIEKQLSRIKELAEAKEKNKSELYTLERGLVDHILLMEDFFKVSCYRCYTSTRLLFSIMP